MTSEPVPVVDLFAGPGGLGEGFSSLRSSTGHPVFRIALSIEKDHSAHQTLELRSFFRQFRLSDVPDDYYLHLRGKLTRDELFRRHTEQAKAAQSEAWNTELGKENPSAVDTKIRRCLEGSPTWVLCGGPPCQAYSLIGRSRNGGINESDHRLYLYQEYLRILVEHRPSIFIFENVKGLLSSRLGANGIFDQILSDLTDPHHAIGSGKPSRYRVYSLSVAPPSAADTNGVVDYRDFIIKCEDYGVPQSRHRVILVGINEDILPPVLPKLVRVDRPVKVSRVLAGLPRLRSGLTHTADSKTAWQSALRGLLGGDFLDDTPNGKGTALRNDMRRTLRRLRVPQKDRGAEFIHFAATSEYRPDWFCDDRLGGVCNHVSRPHIKEDLYRYLFAASYARLYDGSPELRDFPPHLLPKHKNVLDAKKALYFDDRFRVQLHDRPATTITSHIAKDGHYYIHYDETQCRSLTVREAARLQTFPDNYLFCGTRTQQYIQVGNAVPPLLAHQIAEIIAKVLFNGVPVGSDVSCPAVQKFGGLDC